MANVLLLTAVLRTACCAETQKLFLLSNTFHFQTQAGVEYLMLTPDRCLIFPSVDYVRNLVTKHSIKQAVPVVIDCSHVYGTDYTAATVIETLTKDFAARNQLLFFYNLKPSVSSVFEGLSPKEFVVYYNEEELDELLTSRSYVKRRENGSCGV